MFHSYFYLVQIFCLLRLCLGQFFLHPVVVNESALVPRVVGGTPVELGELPYQVTLNVYFANYSQVQCEVDRSLTQ